jgi:hypothetical protein
MALNKTINYNINVTQMKNEINYLTPHYNNLQRKKSLSLSVLPRQNNQFLCVPLSGSQPIDHNQLCKSHSIEDLRLKREKSFESLRRITSQTSMVFILKLILKILTLFLKFCR